MQLETNHRSAALLTGLSATLFDTTPSKKKFCGCLRDLVPVTPTSLKLLGYRPSKATVSLLSRAFLVTRQHAFCYLIFLSVVMNYILSFTGSSARAVRDAVSSRIWPTSFNQEVVKDSPSDQINTSSRGDISYTYLKTGRIFI